jgi:hypothetical protein
MFKQRRGKDGGEIGKDEGAKSKKEYEILHQWRSPVTL